MSDAPGEITADLEQQGERISYLENQVRHFRLEAAYWRDRYFGRGSEKRVLEGNLEGVQLGLYGERNLDPAAPQAAETETLTYTRKKRGHGRPAFPEHLPRNEVALDLDEHEKSCDTCGTGLRKIGEDVTERGHFVPARFEINRYVCSKYACPAGHQVKAPTPPSALIDRCKYEPSVYADVVTSKYTDHLPLHRQEQIWKRRGVKLPRSTMCDMVARVDELIAQPIVAVMKEQVLASDLLSVDETRLKVLIEGMKGIHQAWVWVWRCGEKVVFDFTMSRGTKEPVRFLGDWTGTLQSDGYLGYDVVVKANNLIRAGCWAHARRKFVEALDLGIEDAREHVARIARLYWIESALEKRRRARGLDEESFHRLRFDVRRRRSRRVVDRFDDRIDELRVERHVLPASRFGKAVTYAWNQRLPLRRFLADGRLQIDNNHVERAIRPLAIGRKNWLFAGSPKGAERAARLMTLLCACKVQGIDPQEYLTDVLNRTLTLPAREIHRLTPWAWAAERRAAAETAPSD